MSASADPPGIQELEKKTIAHLEVLREDGRDEIKRRIQQRDQYSIQLTIALAAVLTASFVGSGSRKIVVLAPLVAIYFVKLILTSYRLHELIVKWLRSEIEPRLANLCNTPPEIELETWLAEQEKPGLRRRVFVVALWAVVLLSMIYLLLAYRHERLFLLQLGVVFAVYVLLAVRYVGVKLDSGGE